MNDFEKLFFDHHPVLCRLVFRFVQDQEISRDIVQEVFIRYWKKMETDPGFSENPGAYLRRSCINEALNYLKETERRTSRESIYAADFGEAAAKHDQADTPLLAGEISSKIQKAVDSLPPVCREVFLLSRYEYMRYSEIASHLGISVNTVEKHIGKALGILRNLLGNE